jgi:hypothetical protein
MEAEVFRAEGQTDMKLIATFRNFTNAPKKATATLCPSTSQRRRGGPEVRIHTFISLALDDSV